MQQTIQTTEELIKSLNECNTKSILQNDLNELELQLRQVQRNIAIVKAVTPESDEEFRARQAAGDQK